MLVFVEGSKACESLSSRTPLAMVSTTLEWRFWMLSKVWQNSDIVAGSGGRLSNWQSSTKDCAYHSCKKKVKN
jgi:hypothetical protein